MAGKGACAKGKMRYTIALALASLLALLMAGCSIGSGVNTSANSSESGTSSTGEVVDAAAMSEIAGTWDLVETCSYDGEEFKAVSNDDLNAWRDVGYEMYISPKEDGTATWVDRYRNVYGTWQMNSGSTGEAALDGVPYQIEVVDSKLVLSIGGFSVLYDQYVPMTFVRANEERNPLSREDYDEYVSGFIGKWNISSASRDGVTIRADRGEISQGLSLEFKDDMSYVMEAGEETFEGRWSVIDLNHGYLDNPADGALITFLTEIQISIDRGDGSSYTFVKEH